jgi:hypothetical protein
MSRSRLTGAFERVPRRDFVYCSGWDGTPFSEQRARLAADPDWNVFDLPTAHNAMRDAPEAVAALLLNTGHLVETNCSNISTARSTWSFTASSPGA